MLICKGKEEIIKGDRALVVEINGSKSIYNVTHANLAENI